MTGPPPGRAGAASARTKGVGIIGIGSLRQLANESTPASSSPSSSTLSTKDGAYDDVPSHLVPLGPVLPMMKI